MGLGCREVRQHLHICGVKPDLCLLTRAQGVTHPPFPPAEERTRRHPGMLRCSPSP